MEAQQLLALALVVIVFAFSAVRWVHRAAAALVGAVVAAFVWGLPNVLEHLLPEVLLVTAGLMILAGGVRRSGLASWLALRAAKLAHGSPTRILVFSGLLTWLLGAVLGPVAAVAMVVPVTLLLAVELDVPPLPFVVVLTWTSLLGAATTLTALPGNLWLGTALDVDALTWAGRMLPFTAIGLVVTLVTGLVVFGKRLRVTNERRARVLEYDPNQSLENPTLVARTAAVLTLVVMGLAAGPFVGLSPALVTVGGALLLWLTEWPRTADRLVDDLDGGTLLFFAGLMVVVGTLPLSGLASSLVLPDWPSFVVLWVSAAATTVLDQGAVAALSLPWLMTAAGGPVAAPWPLVALGTAFGAGVTVLGSLAGTTALSLTGQGSRRVEWQTFTLYGLLFALVNLIVATTLLLVLH